MNERPAARLLPGIVFGCTLLGSVLGFGLLYDRSVAADTAAAMAALDGDLAREGWSAPVRQIAAWAIRTNDHRGLPFVVIDQARGRLFAFSGAGRLAGSTPSLRDPVDVEPSAPAGRFVADTRRSAREGTIVWANDHDMLSLDAAPPPARGRQPLAAGFHHRGGGALHVAGDFYRRHLTAFRHRSSVAYVLPGEPGVHRSQRVYAGMPQPVAIQGALHEPIDPRPRADRPEGGTRRQQRSHVG